MCCHHLHPAQLFGIAVGSIRKDELTHSKAETLSANDEATYPAIPVNIQHIRRLMQTFHCHSVLSCFLIVSGFEVLRKSKNKANFGIRFMSTLIGEIWHATNCLLWDLQNKIFTIQFRDSESTARSTAYTEMKRSQLVANRFPVFIAYRVTATGLTIYENDRPSFWSHIDFMSVVA